MGDNETNILLKVEDLNIVFHDHKRPETAVEDVDFELAQGEILGIVGESGSGKSMTAHAIAGLLHRSEITKSGKILFEGRELLGCKRSELRTLQGNDIGVVFQEPMTALNPVKKIGWQVGEALRIHTKMSQDEIRAKVLEMLASVELDNPEEVYEKYPHELSGGQRQRVCIAAAMICSPKLLIADEPTTALDVTIQAQIIELLRHINRTAGTSILFISHDLSLVRQLCERVIVMRKGLVVEEGVCEEVFDNPKEEYTKQLVAAIPKVDFINKK